MLELTTMDTTPVQLIGSSTSLSPSSDTDAAAVAFGLGHSMLSAQSAYEILKEWSVELEITLPCLFTNRDAPQTGIKHEE